MPRRITLSTPPSPPLTPFRLGPPPSCKLSILIGDDQIELRRSAQLSRPFGLEITAFLPDGCHQSKEFCNEAPRHNKNAA